MAAVSYQLIKKKEALRVFLYNWCAGNEPEGDMEWNGFTQRARHLHKDDNTSQNNRGAKFSDRPAATKAGSAGNETAK